MHLALLQHRLMYCRMACTFFLPIEYVSLLRESREGNCSNGKDAKDAQDGLLRGATGAVTPPRPRSHDARLPNLPAAVRTPCKASTIRLAKTARGPSSCCQCKRQKTLRQPKSSTTEPIHCALSDWPAHLQILKVHPTVIPSSTSPHTSTSISLCLPRLSAVHLLFKRPGLFTPLRGKPTALCRLPCTPDPKPQHPSSQQRSSSPSQSSSSHTSSHALCRRDRMQMVRGHGGDVLIKPSHRPHK